MSAPTDTEPLPDLLSRAWMMLQRARDIGDWAGECQWLAHIEALLEREDMPRAVLDDECPTVRLG